MIGEDSGIEVDGLGVRRGWSRRGSAATTRSAGCSRRSRAHGARTAAAATSASSSPLAPSGEEVRGTGVLDGEIAESPRGTEGFGYDPVFVPEGEVRTVAELGNEWKAQNSHRARAARALLAAL